MKDLTITLQKLLGVTADGVIGSKTLAAIAKALGCDATAKDIQKAVGATADGVIGVKTLTAIISKLGGKSAAKVIDPLVKKYIEKPITYTKVNYKTKLVKQSEVRSGKSVFGKAGCESELVSVPVPANYPLKYGSTPVKTIRIHKLVADRLEAALQDIINHYGEDIEKVAPAICKYDGSYNFRQSRGGSSQSIHSWGIALDFDAENNTMKMKAPQARLSQDIYKPFFDIMEHHGFMSLGRRNNYDWMHIQGALWG